MAHCSTQVHRQRALRERTIHGISALRTVACSFESAGASRAASCGTEHVRPASSERRHSGEEPRERSRAPLPRVKPPPSSSDEEEEEERDSPIVEGAAGKSDPARRPPEPHPPRSHQEHERETGRRHRDQSDDRAELPRRKNKGKKRSNRGSRGGAKHPRKYCLLSNPDLVIHHRPPRSHWQSGRPLAGHWPREDRR